MQSLQDLIDVITRNRNLHISILDLSGILNTPLTEISLRNVIHSKPFCDAAKSGPKGNKLCLRCKRLANTKATVYKEAFCGCCFWGLFEAAVPVVIHDTAMAIVYVGNIIIDKAETEKRINRLCRYTGAEPYALLEAMEKCEYTTDGAEALVIAQIVSDYLKLLYEKTPKRSDDLHWLVAQLKRHIEGAYCSSLSLCDLACIYHKNEKYMGRLFKKETGQSFHEYCNYLRLQKAEYMLENTSEKIIDIAFECGFNNISYFNRIFQKKHGVSPGEYRVRNNKSKDEAYLTSYKK